MKVIPTKSSTACVDYLGRVSSESDPQVDRQRVLFASGQHCRPQTAAAEFKALRKEHGREGEMRTVPAKYIQAEGLDPTHLKVGKNWRAAKRGEKATHTRIEPSEPLEKRAEGYHYIISFAPDTVNRDDPEQCRRAFEAVEAMWAQDYSGVQATLVAHGDAKGSKDAMERGEEGKFHVHVAANAVIHSEMEVDGRVYSPGRRMAGALTNVDTMRERWDRFLQTRGHEFGLEAQDRNVLPEVGSPEYRAVRKTNQDFWENERGEISDHDRARRGIETAFEKLSSDPATMAQLSGTERMQLLADEVASGDDLALKMRSTNDGLKIRSFVVPGRKQAIGATKLGDRYTNDGAAEQLGLIAQGRWKPLQHGRSGPVKEIPALDDAEVTRLQQVVDQMAARETEEQKLDAWLQDWAAEEGTTVEALWASRGRTGSTEDRQVAHRWKAEHEAQRVPEKAAASQTLPAPAPDPRRQVAPVAEDPLDSYRQEHGVELAAASQALAAHLAPRYANEDPKVLAQIVESKLRAEAEFGTLGNRLQEVRDDLGLERRSSGDAGTEQAPRNLNMAERVTAVERSDAARAASSPTGHRAEHTPAARTSATQTGQKPSPSRPRRLRHVGRLSPAQMEARELIAVVRQERADGGAYVDFQLAADDPAASRRAGLYLHAKRVERQDKQGQMRKTTDTWQQLSPSEYARLQLVAGENATEVEGRPVFAVRGDVAPWARGDGYAVVPHTIDASPRKGVDNGVLRTQREAEDAVRATEQSPQERAFTNAQLQAQKTRSRGGLEM